MREFQYYSSREGLLHLEKVAKPEALGPEIGKLLTSKKNCRGKRLLDLGCGPGIHSGHFRRKYSLKVVGADYSETLLKRAKKRFPQVEFVRMDFGRKFPFENGSFDFVFANASLIHLTKREFRKALPRIFRVLSKGGRLFLTVRKGRGFLMDSRSRKYTLYSKKELRSFLENSGFSVEEIWTRKSASEKGRVWLEAFCKTKTKLQNSKLLEK